MICEAVSVGAVLWCLGYRDATPESVVRGRFSDWRAWQSDMSARNVVFAPEMLARLLGHCGLTSIESARDAAAYQLCQDAELEGVELDPAIASAAAAELGYWYERIAAEPPPESRGGPSICFCPCGGE